MFCVLIDFRQLEEIQLQLAKANEKATDLQESVDQTARRADEEQQETHKKHQAELQKLQDKLDNLVRTVKGKAGWLGRCSPRGGLATQPTAHIFFPG